MIAKQTRAKSGHGLLAEYERALSYRRLVRDFGLTAETAPEIVAEAERIHGRLEIRNTVAGESAELVLDGPVWPSEWAFPGEISPANVREALEKLGDVSTVRIYLNSPGGDPYAGHAIHGMLQRFAAEVIVHIEGIAASAASIIAVGADKLVVAPNSTFMVHSAMMGMLGWFNAQELRKEADTLDQVDKSLIAAYAMKTGRDEAELRAMVEAETWMVGKEIVDEGFADELLESKTVSAKKPAVVACKGAGPPEEPAAPPPADETESDAKTDEQDELKMLAMELELLTGSSF